MNAIKPNRVACLTALSLIMGGCGNNVECTNVNAQDDLGKTQLHSAAILRNLDLVKCLLNNGAYVNMVDIKGWTPLHSAALRSNNIKIVKLLVEYGAFVDVMDSLGDTPLDIARGSKNWEVVMFLEKH